MLLIKAKLGEYKFYAIYLTNVMLEIPIRVKPKAEIAVTNILIIKTAGPNPQAHFSIMIKNTGTITVGFIIVTETSGILRDNSG